MARDEGPVAKRQKRRLVKNLSSSLLRQFVHFETPSAFLPASLPALGEELPKNCYTIEGMMDYDDLPSSSAVRGDDPTYSDEVGASMQPLDSHDHPDAGLTLSGISGMEGIEEAGEEEEEEEGEDAMKDSSEEEEEDEEAEEELALLRQLKPTFLQLLDYRNCLLHLSEPKVHELEDVFLSGSSYTRREQTSSFRIPDVRRLSFCREKDQESMVQRDCPKNLGVDEERERGAEEVGSRDRLEEEVLEHEGVKNGEKLELVEVSQKLKEAGAEEGRRTR
ncbi:hypothetical protein BT69DRAFT_1299608 [Atractiella rhizophila]|nr:hypothetical protein BT69DRAFT_1299608 [Atractiella rhizophila]